MPKAGITDRLKGAAASAKWHPPWEIHQQSAYIAETYSQFCGNTIQLELQANRPFGRIQSDDPPAIQHALEWVNAHEYQGARAGEGGIGDQFSRPSYPQVRRLRFAACVALQPMVPA